MQVNEGKANEGGEGPTHNGRLVGVAEVGEEVSVGRGFLLEELPEEKSGRHCTRCDPRLREGEVR